MTLQENTTTLPPNLAALLPLDKSWVIRMGVLDLLAGRPQALEFLRGQGDLGDDLAALRDALVDWPAGKAVHVRESGTLYRFLRFADWKLDLGKTIVKAGTLPSRPVCDDPSIVSWPQRKLLALDGGTSQWASAAAILGDETRLPDPPFKLRVTYEAVAHWRARRDAGEPWEARRDASIASQAAAFLRAWNGQPLEFEPEQAEDYCFARAFGLVDAAHGERRWPALRGHESDRIAEMETALAESRRGQPTSSRDHRVVQAISLRQAALGERRTGACHPGCVTKSWPKFWDFLAAATGR